MTVSHALYQLLIGPLELIFEVVYFFAKFLTSNSGLSIVALSLSMNVLLLPLYRRADAIQEEERAVEKKMDHWVRHIKQNFSGNERFMMLQTYYRQNHYKPFYALKGSLPLLLEIPFFIAAYHFLSNLEELRGMPFGPIYDLGAPDGLLRIGSLRIHVLPILMTAINLVSSAIYTRGLPLKDKLQLYGMALIFLILLYPSPAGLVLYWSLNNLFSLIKNLLAKLKNPKRILRVFLAVAGLALFAYVLLFYTSDYKYSGLFLILIAIAMELPLLLAMLGKLWKGKSSLIKRFPETPNHRGYLLGCLGLTVLTGMLIPSAVIRSSPSQFVFYVFRSPLWHVADALLLAAGLFLLWFGIFYYLAPKRGKWIFGLVIWFLLFAGIINYMFFGTGLGDMTPELKYNNGLHFENRELFWNSILVVVLLVVLALVWTKLSKLTVWVTAILSVAIFSMSMVNVFGIQRELPAIQEEFRLTQARQQAAAERTGDIRIRLSTKGQNVVVIMLDRAIGSYIPYLFQEKPELQEQFAGFVYYPNTISYGGHTNFGAPPLFGGYEYTPEEMNRRDDLSLAEKHDQALKLMPILFGRAGFDVTVFDPPYAGYRWNPDLRTYDEFESKYGFPVHAFITEQGQFNPVPPEEMSRRLEQCWSRNFFCYSVMKISPLAMQSVLYQNARYCSSDLYVQIGNGLSRAVGYDADFMNSYSVLTAMCDITRIVDDSSDNLLLMQNSTTHQAMLLQTPDYVPAPAVDNQQYDAEHSDRFTYNGRRMTVETQRQMNHYHVNMAALMAVGDWLDYLRENGVYDNTRIIIVSDHGSNLRQFDDLIFGPEEDQDVMFYNPLLLVKDFGSQDAFTTSDAFMTNADVPTLALAEVIPDPINPFTGNPVNSDAKESGPQKVFGSHIYQIDQNNGNIFLPGPWYYVHDDIFDLDNWEIHEEP